MREKVNAIVDSFVFGQVYDQFGEEIEERALTKVVIETPFQEQISSKFWGGASTGWKPVETSIVPRSFH